MKRFITVSDVQEVLRTGGNVFPVGPGDVVTSAARDLAQSKGLAFSDKAGASSTLPSVSSGHVNNKSPSDYKIPQPGAGNFDGPYRFSGMLSEAELLKWREEFPILKNIIHVGNCSQSAQAKRVRAAINAYLDNWLTVGMDWESWVKEVILAKEEFAKLIGADADEIAVASCASDLVSSIASTLDYSGKRPKIVCTEAEFPTVGHIWLGHQKYGAKIDYVPVKNGAIDLADYERYVDDTTLLTSITHVYYQNGFKQDLDAIVDICHRKGSLVMVDGYQACGTAPIDVHKQKIDIYLTGNLKYMFGIPGIAFMYVNRNLVPMLKPARTGWFGQENPFSFKVRILDYASDGRRFDTGTPMVLTSYAARAGMQILNEVGVPAIAERIDFLSRVAIEEADKHGLDMVSPRDISKKGGTTAIRLKFDSHDMEVELKKRNVIGSARGEVIRVAPHFYTTASEIAYVMEQIADIIKMRS